MQNTEFRRGRHCVFMMHVHLVFVTKYRCARFSADQLGFLKDIFESVCKDFNAELVEMNGERDHVHLLVNYPPSVSVSKLVNSLKGVSSRMLRKSGSKDALDHVCGRLRILPPVAAELRSRLSRHTSRIRRRRINQNLAAYISDLKDGALRRNLVKIRLTQKGTPISLLGIGVFPLFFREGTCLITYSGPSAPKSTGRLQAADGCTWSSTAAIAL